MGQMGQDVSAHQHTRPDFLKSPESQDLSEFGTAVNDRGKRLATQVTCSDKEWGLAVRRFLTFALNIALGGTTAR